MQVLVRLSGELARVTGVPRTAVQVPDGSTVADLLAALTAHHPGLVGRIERAIPVVGGRHASATEVLQDGQEVAFIVPVGGGRP